MIAFGAGICLETSRHSCFHSWASCNRTELRFELALLCGIKRWPHICLFPTDYAISSQQGRFMNWDFSRVREPSIIYSCPNYYGS